MDFTLTEEQRELSGLARRIMTEVETPQRQWSEFAAAGLLDVELDFLEQCTVLTELGRVASQLPYLPSIVLGAAALARFGVTDQQAQWAARAATGDIVLAVGLTPDAPIDAEKTEDGWVISGSLTTVLAGAEAAYILIPTEDGLFIVAVDDEGVTVQSQQMTGPKSPPG